MFSPYADLFFRSPRSEFPRTKWYGGLYPSPRDIAPSIGIHPTTGGPVAYRAEWPGAMTMLAGIDLLAKFFAGSDKRGQVGDRFCGFVERFLVGLTQSDREVIYQLRNSLLHSFG